MREGGTPRTIAVRGGAAPRGGFLPPGDKSITHRAFLFGLIAEGETWVRNANGGHDCSASLGAVRALGGRVSSGADGVRIVGVGGRLREPDGVIDCGNSGTTMRLLAGLVAAHPIRVVLDGDDSLRSRPMRRIVEPLRQMGAGVQARDNDLPPLRIEGRTLRPIAHACEVASAQVLGCVLLAGLGAHGSTSVALPGPARDHTERMLPLFGLEPVVSAERGAVRVSIRGPATLRAASLDVPGDPSAAAFFLAAAAATPGARVTARGVSANPTRTGFLEVLERMGASVLRTPAGVASGEPVEDVSVEGPSRLRGFEVPADWVPRLIDEIPAWSIAAAVADGTSTISGATELRVKESDRIAALARGLSAFGVRVDERPDGLAVHGGRLSPARIDAGNDHRMAMAFAMLGALADGQTEVRGAESIASSYPAFVETFNHLGGEVEESSG